MKVLDFSDFMVIVGGICIDSGDGPIDVDEAGAVVSEYAGATMQYENGDVMLFENGDVMIYE
jgi:hypothetical protein